VTEHPRYVFGGLLAVLVGWLYYSYKRNAAIDAAVDAHIASAPIAVKEVIEVGRANRVPLAVFAATMERALRECRGGVASPAEISFILRDELRKHDDEAAAGSLSSSAKQASAEAAVGAGSGSSSTSSDTQQAERPRSMPQLRQEHHLLRAAAALPALPASERAQWLQVTSAGLPPPTARELRALAEPSRDVYELLSLYGTTMGVKAEPRASIATTTTATGAIDKPPPPGILPPKSEFNAFADTPKARRAAAAAAAAAEAAQRDRELATPSQRLALYLHLAEAAQAAATPKTDAPSITSASRSALAAAAPSAAATAPAPWSIEAASQRQYSQAHVAATIALLASTAQLPTRARVAVTSKYPLPVAGMRSPAQHVADGLVECGLAGKREFKDEPDRPLSWEQLRVLMFDTKAVCAWGECYARDRE
jgi:hypothetical protein